MRGGYLHRGRGKGKETRSSGESSLSHHILGFAHFPVSSVTPAPPPRPLYSLPRVPRVLARVVQEQCLEVIVEGVTDEGGT